MPILDHLEPQAVFSYFEQLCAIPHGSGNTKAISDYCVRFAQERGLRCVQDAVNNIIIWKGGTPGYENAPTVILQGHLDMVAEKTPDSPIDFTKDPLDLQIDGETVKNVTHYAARSYGGEKADALSTSSGAALA